MLVAEDSHGIFYSQESYVLRWAFIITVVRELEGLTPGQGLFARDRQYKKDMEAKKKDEGGAGGGVGGGGGGKEEVVAKKKGDDSDSDSDFEASDEESQRVLESGGRDRCAYFFWQGDCHVVYVCVHAFAYSVCVHVFIHCSCTLCVCVCVQACMRASVPVCLD